MALFAFELSDSLDAMNIISSVIVVSIIYLFIFPTRLLVGVLYSVEGLGVGKLT